MAKAKKKPRALPMGDLEWIRKRFLAGDTIAGIRAGRPGYPACALRSFRDELFADLRAHPAKVKDLACGEVLNANEIVKYRDRAPRRSAQVEQVEMFPGVVLA